MSGRWHRTFMAAGRKRSPESLEPEFEAADPSSGPMSFLTKDCRFVESHP
jgi:hypothetical protein